MQIEISERVQFTDEYYFSKKLREIEEMNRQGDRVINLGIGSPDLPPADIVTKTLADELKKPDVHGYQSYRGIPRFRQAVANWYQTKYGVIVDSETEIIPLMGSKEGIMHICMTYLQKGDACLVPNPGYPTYSAAVNISGAKVISYDLTSENNWLPDLKALERSHDLREVKLMWLNYPHMPTGALAPATFFRELVAFCQKHQILVCHDNPYSFILTEKPISLLSTPGALDCALELNSFSKTFNMAGWRLGMMLGRAKRLQEVMRFKSNMDSGMFYPLQVAAVEALNLDDSWYTTTNTVYKERRALVYQLLDMLGCNYDRNQVGLFVWALIPKTYMDGYSLCDQVLEDCRVFITPGGIFGSNGEQYIRVSLCSPQKELRLAIKRLSNLTNKA